LNRSLGQIVAGLGLGAALLLPAASASAQKINCANEFRSGKLYFSQSIFDKAVQRFALAVETCPQKAEYRARYAVALCQYGEVRMTDALAMDPEPRAPVLASVATWYDMAGREFDSSLVYDNSKSNQKFVRENREHYWVARYNEGIKLLKDNKPADADFQFRLARFVDKAQIKAYSQGALALINQDKKSEAASLVQHGLEIDPKDDQLNKLQESIYLDAARALVREAEDMADSQEDAPKAVDKTDQALTYLNQVLEKRGGKDPDVLFDRGSAYLARGRALDEADTSDVVPPDAVDADTKAAADFAAAAELVPADDPDNHDFHLAARFNEIQAYMNAESYDTALEKIRAYAGLDPMDPAIWQMWAVCLSKKGDSKGALSALMAYKSLNPGAGGSEVPVADAVSTAKADAAAAVKELGNPDAVYSYQESGSQNVIETWIWTSKKQVRSYILGVIQGQLTW